jgi:hypothetical protein
MIYIRTCQECLYRQPSKPPADYKGKDEAWRELKCRRCQSRALDYGKWVDNLPKPKT